jgi:hypothetical protein
MTDFQIGDRVRLRFSGEVEQYGWVRTVSWNPDGVVGVRWDPYGPHGYRNRAVDPTDLELIAEPPIEAGPAALVEWLDG